MPSTALFFLRSPSQPSEIGTLIERARTEAAQYCKQYAVKAWPQMDICANLLADKVLEKIDECDVLMRFSAPVRPAD